MHHEVALRQRHTAIFRRKAVVRRMSCGLQRAPGICVASEQAPLRWLPFGRRRKTQACHAHAPCRAGRDRPTHHRKTPHWREASNPQCKTVVRRASCDLQHAPGLRVAREQAPLRWLSFWRRRKTQACRARAPSRAGRDRPTHHRKTLHWRKASNPQCKTMVRRASCDLQRAPGLRVARDQAPLRWLSLGRWRHTRACVGVQRAALFCSAYAPYSGTSPAVDLYLSAQDRGATCELWPPTHTRHSR